MRSHISKTALAFLSALAILSTTAIASAEWAEAPSPCNVAPGAIFPQSVRWFQVGEQVDVPQGYFTYGATPGEAPPASDFTAVVNWGDGTTAPASVEPTSVGDCYAVLAANHSFGAVGSYSFSYTVHDVKTGFDHTLAPTEFHVWSIMPTLVGDASARTIRPAVGSFWSGVLAEFHYENPAGNPNGYSAQIAWGDGEPPTQGTISAASLGVFSVSGSHTYAKPLHGTVTVRLSYNLPVKPLGAWSASDVETLPLRHSGPAPRWRLVGQARLVAIDHGRRQPSYEIAFRLNRTLPRMSKGHVGAVLEFDGRRRALADLAATGNCYVAHITWVSKDKPKTGVRYPFTLYVGLSDSTQIDGSSLLRRFPNVAQMRRATSRQLNCG